MEDGPVTTRTGTVSTKTFGADFLTSRGIGLSFWVPAEPVSRSHRLAEDLNSRFSAERAFAITDVGKAMRSADGLIHATPTGMKNHPGLPIEESWLEPRHWVADIVYMPLKTELLALATRLGCRTLPGGGMTVFQAAAAFKLFSGIEPDAERMSAHFTELCKVS